jgi:hypothetical protein
MWKKIQPTPCTAPLRGAHESHGTEFHILFNIGSTQFTTIPASGHLPKALVVQLYPEVLNDV